MRIYCDAKSEKQPRLSDYFDELLSDDELLEKSSARLAAFFEASIGGAEELTEH